MSRNILGQGQAGTFLVGGQLNINTLGATKIQGDRITNNSIDFYTADVEATSQDDWNINLNNGGLGSASKFVVKNNDTTKMTMDDSGLNLASGMVYKINNSQISTSSLSDGNNLVLTTGNQTIGGNKTFSNIISGDIDGNSATATSASTLTTPRTIAGVSFNGSQNIDIPSSGLSDGNNIVLLTGNQTIGGNKTFSNVISGNINGNSATSTLATTATRAVELQTARTIAGVSFDGGSNIDIPSSGLSDGNNIVLLTGNQTIGGNKTFSNTITADLNGNAFTSSNCSGNSATATTLATPRTIAGVSFNGSQNISIASTDLSNTAKILLTDVEQTITSTKNYTTGILTFGTGQPSTLPGVINSNGKVYIHGGSGKGLTIARSDLYDRDDGNGLLTKREWNINTSNTNTLRFIFVQEDDGGGETDTTGLTITTNGIETNKLTRTSGNLEIEADGNIVINVDYNDTGTANLISFRDHDEEMVKIYRSSSGGTENVMSKSFLQASGYIRADNAIIRQSTTNRIDLGIMFGVSTDTDDSDAGELRFKRYNPSSGGLENIRFHSIKVSCSGTASQNLMEFYLHDGAGNAVDQTKVLTLRGDNEVIIDGDLTISGSITHSGGTYVVNTANNTFSGGNTFNGNVNFTPASSLISGGMRFNTTGISYPTEQSNEGAGANTFHALMFLSNKYRMNMNGGNTKSISSNVVSDARIKNNIRDADDKDGEELINKLEVKRFDLGYTEFSKNLDIEITPQDNQIGFIAQDLEKLIPDAVEDEGQIKSIDLSYIVPYLVKNLQQNNKIIAELNKKVEDLEETILGLME